MTPDDEEVVLAFRVNQEFGGDPALIAEELGVPESEVIELIERHNGCAFCDYQGPSEILDSFPRAFVIEPIKPVVPGHVLVIPYRHADNFWSDPLLTAYVTECASLYAAHRGGQWNLITSAGEFATQTVRHLHVHLVPRQEGDGLRLPWA